MKKFSKNALMLLSTLLLNNITSTFIYTFLLAYILDVSNNGIVNVALFYLVLHVSMIVLSFVMAPLFKKINKATSLLIGVLFKFAFVLFVVFFQEKVIHYVYLIAILNAIGEVLFWGGANPLQAVVTNRYSLPLYLSISKIIGKIMGLVIPVVMGLIIDEAGIKIISVLMVVITLIQLVLSLFIKVPTEKDNSKLLYKEFIQKAKRYYPQTKQINVNQLLFGIVSNMGTITLYYTVITFGSNLSIGIFSTIASIISMLVLVAYNIKRNIGSNNIITIASSILMDLSVVLILISLNKVSLTIFYLLWNITSTIPDTITGAIRLNVTKNLHLQKYNIENITISEVYLDLGRVIGEIMLLIMGLANIYALDIACMCIMAIVITIYYIHTCVLQKSETKLFTKSRTEQQKLYRNNKNKADN